MTYPNETARTSGSTGSTAFTEVSMNPPIAGPSKAFIPNDVADGQSVTLVLYAHGAGGDETQVSSPAPLATRNGALDEGWVVLSSLGGGAAAWGNDAALDSYVAAAEWAQGIWDVQNVILWGASMGGLTVALLYASGRIERVRCMVVIDGAVNLRAFYDMTPHQINTAYDIYTPAGRTYETQTAGHDPCLLPASSFSGLPIFLSASPADGLVVKANHTDVFYPIVGPTADVTYMVGSGAHFAASNFFPTESVAFMQTHLQTVIPPPAGPSGLYYSDGSPVVLYRSDGTPVVVTAA